MNSMIKYDKLQSESGKAQGNLADNNVLFVNMVGF